MLILPLLLLTLPGLAWETDQRTDRAQPLAPADDLLDARMDLLLDQAVEATNRRTGCQGDDQTQRQALAQALYRRAGTQAWIGTRGLLLAFSYCHYTAWVETDPAVPLRYHFPREGQYARVKVWEGVFLSIGGGAGTVSLGGVLVGTDKLHHFLDEGYIYARRSDWGADWEPAQRWGRWAESSFFGMWSSSAYSFADLRADLDGGHFYVSLLQPGSVVQRGADGCLERVEPFHWADWVRPEYDEFVNPSQYTRGARRGLDRRLLPQQEATCALWAALPEDQRAIRWIEVPDYALPTRFERQDPYRIAELCTEAALSPPGADPAR